MTVAFSAQPILSTGLARFALRGLWALPVWAILLMLSTLTHQPDPDTAFPQYAEYITTTRFLISHLVASIFGAGIGMLGLIALFIILARGNTLRLAIWALVTSIIGNSLVISVFGAAAFAQPAIGNAYLAGQQAEAMAFDDNVYGPALFATALPGLLLFTIGIVLFGLAVRRSGTLPGLAGIIFAVSGVFFGIIGFAFIDVLQPIGGALMAVSTAWIAYEAQRSTAPAGEPSPAAL